MEDPVSFDIWCKVKTGAKLELIDWVMKEHSIARIDAMKVVMNLLKTDKYLQVYSDRGWDDIQKLKKSLPSFVDSCEITESTYKPGEYLKYCDEHSLYYATDDSCPVCGGFYIKTIKGGKRFI